jgi:hypothetical protein
MVVKLLENHAAENVHAAGMPAFSVPINMFT